MVFILLYIVTIFYSCRRNNIFLICFARCSGELDRTADREGRNADERLAHPYNRYRSLTLSGDLGDMRLFIT